MSAPEIIDLCSDGEAELEDIKDIKPIILSTVSKEAASYSVIVDNGRLAEHNLHLSTFRDSYGPPCRQFWKSGDYELGHALEPLPRNGQNRLRIHPKFLHSNATSHKWAFGAIAELLDNAIDEVQNGATFVIVDKFTNPRNGDPSLLVHDDGGGMDPESLRRCMSFGFSDKQSGSTIGQYGNGFKTSTMRLGADVIVFTRCMKRKLTQSIGLLSYTFLRQTGCDDIVVPVVDYDFNHATGEFVHLVRIDEKQFSSNLTTLLKWSPFATESELLRQFDDLGDHGTKVIVFNLWHNDDGVMELDFEADAEDILITGGQKKVRKVNVEAELNQNSVASRYQYSLRVYSSILYLKPPEKFKILLRGKIVEPHHIIKDLVYIECIRYRPQVDINQEVIVDTTIGFLKGAPDVNIQGFNVYHKNRLILPFWIVAHNSYGKGRGVVGVLEANFIKPTHDKQDFERSSIYQKLEIRLKEMTYEYWDLYCHLVGYKNKKLHHRISVPQLLAPDSSRALQLHKMNGTASFCKALAAQSVVALSAPTFPSAGLPQKRKLEIHSSVPESFKSCSVTDGSADGHSGNYRAMVKFEHSMADHPPGRIRRRRAPAPVRVPQQGDAAPLPDHRGDALDTAVPLEATQHLLWIRQWPLTCPLFLALVQRAGLGMLQFLLHIRLDILLLTALVERWSPQTNTFHMVTGEMTVTLQDVAVILGCRIDGPAMIGQMLVGPGLRWESWPECCLELLGGFPVQDHVYENPFRPGQTATFTMGSAATERTLPLRYLLWTYGRQSYADWTPDNLIRAVRAYILFAIGCFYLPDTSGSEVDMQWLLLMEDLDVFASLSLGGAVLAHLYRELALSTRPRRRHIGGCLQLLQVWSWERMYVGRPTLLLPQLRDAHGHPLGHRWSQSFLRDAPTGSLVFYRDELDCLQQSQVIFTPYSDELLMTLPDICRDGRDIWVARVPLISWIRVEWHMPDRVFRQFGFDQHVDITPMDPQFRRIDGRGRAGTDWYYQDRQYRMLWDLRREHLQDAMFVDEDPQVALYIYLEWYVRWVPRLHLTRGPSSAAPTTYAPRGPFERNFAAFLETTMQFLHDMPPEDISPRVQADRDDMIRLGEHLAASFHLHDHARAPHTPSPQHDDAFYSGEPSVVDEGQCSAAAPDDDDADDEHRPPRFRRAPDAYTPGSDALQRKRRPR